jgi:hypothetical protein
MKRITLAALAATLSIFGSALAVSSASAALPSFLPEKGITLSGTNTATVVLETLGGTSVACAANSASASITGPQSGTFSVVFEKCKSKGFIEATCTGLSDTTTGNITVSGNIDLRRKSIGGLAVILFLPGTVHFSCSIVLISVTGKVACLISPENTDVKPPAQFTITCELNKGDAIITSVTNAAETGTEAVELKTSINEGTPESSGQLAVEKLTASALLEVMS